MEQEHQSNNHHSIVKFNGQWILFYHRWLDTPDSTCDKRQRHVSAEFISFDDAGRIRPVVRTNSGLSNLRGADKSDDSNNN